MRITYRTRGVKDYWAARWDGIAVDGAMTNPEVYPLKYARLTVRDKDGEILEAGCGAGRILRYYHQRGFRIVGIDFIDSVVRDLRRVDHSLKVEVGDITRLRFGDNRFRYVLAFGLYHNLEHGLEKAVAETFRVLEPGGAVCASFRADNLQTRITDWLKEKEEGDKSGRRVFHKMNLTRNEFVSLFTRAGFKVEKVFPVENMPMLYRFSMFRASGHRRFDENKARVEGYRLSLIGRWMQKFLMRFFPDQFCNVYVLIAHKGKDASFRRSDGRFD